MITAGAKNRNIAAAQSGASAISEAIHRCDAGGKLEKIFEKMVERRRLKRARAMPIHQEPGTTKRPKFDDAGTLTSCRRCSTHRRNVGPRCGRRSRTRAVSRMATHDSDELQAARQRGGRCRPCGEPARPRGRACRGWRQRRAQALFDAVATPDRGGDCRCVGRELHPSSQAAFNRIADDASFTTLRELVMTRPCSAPPTRFRCAPAAGLSPR